MTYIHTSDSCCKLLAKKRIEDVSFVPCYKMFVFIAYKINPFCQ